MTHKPYTSPNTTGKINGLAGQKTQPKPVYFRVVTRIVAPTIIIPLMIQVMFLLNTYFINNADLLKKVHMFRLKELESMIINDEQ